MITADGDDQIVITYEAGTNSTHETGTTTGDDQVDGIETTDGTKTNEEAGTVTITEAGTETITADGTENGTFSYETMATDDIISTSYDGNDETHETGTTTGETHVAGIVTTDGTVTND